MDECVLVCQFIQAIFRKSGPAAVDELTLPLLAHPSAAVLSTLVAMFSKGFNSGAKKWIKATYVAILRFLMMRSPRGFSYVSNICAVFDPTGSLHTNHFLLGLWYTTPTPLKNEPVTPLQV